MKLHFHFLSIGTALGLVSSSFATLTGLNDSPLGTRTNEDIRYAVWDAYTVNAGTISPGSTLTADLSQSGVSNGSSVYGNYTPTGGTADDLFYASTGTTVWSLSFEAPIDMVTAVLQIKMTGNSAYYSPLLNGGSATPEVTATGLTNEFSGFSVIQWTWQNLEIVAGQTVTITFSNPAGQHTAVDTIALDVSSSAVPEPSTWALLGFGTIGAFIYARRVRRLA